MCVGGRFVCVYHILFIHLSVDGLLGCFCILAIVNKVAPFALKAKETGIAGSWELLGVPGSLVLESQEAPVASLPQYWQRWETMGPQGLGPAKVKGQASP